MNKSDLIAAAAKRTGRTQKEVEEVVNAALAVLEEAIVAGDKVHISNFGIFEVKVSAPRQGRNPRTNEIVPIPAKRIPTFKPSKHLKAVVC